MKLKTPLLITLLTATAAYAVPFTETSPTSKGVLPTGATPVGGIVLDAVGLNGARLVSQLAASTLYVGFAGTNPFTVGTQTGLSAGLLSQLGGGFSELAVRITLYDGDTAAGNFDSNDNTLLLNGINIGNWSSVNAQTTNSAGTIGGSFSGGGFRDDTLDTGWFNVTNAGILASIFNSITLANQLVYEVNDVDPFDNFYDFTQGVDGGLINVGVPPVVTPPTTGVPDGGATLMLLSSALAGLAGFKRRFVS